MSKLEEQKALPRRKLFKFPEKIAESASRTPRFLRKIKVKVIPPPGPVADIAEITKFMTETVAMRRGWKLTKRKAKKAKRKP